MKDSCFSFLIKEVVMRILCGQSGTNVGSASNDFLHMNNLHILQKMTIVVVLYVPRAFTLQLKVMNATVVLFLFSSNRGALGRCRCLFSLHYVIEITPVYDICVYKMDRTIMVLVDG